MLFSSQTQQTANVDPTKADAIRRTIYVGNVPQVVTEEELISFFTPCGSVKFVRIQGDPTAPSKYDSSISFSKKLPFLFYFGPSDVCSSPYYVAPPQVRVCRVWR